MIELTQIKEEFKKIQVSEEYKKEALKNIKIWLTKPEFEEYRPQIKYLIQQKNYSELLDCFYQVIPFGTGGRRGLVGIGPNRINKWTIQSSAQGHSKYLLKKHPDAKKRGIVIAYDVREYHNTGVYSDKLPNPVEGLSCKDLAEAAAQVYLANKIKVYLFDDVRSTPELSFAIRQLKAVSGIMISASHNPPEYNGKKVYDEYGGQLIPPYDQELVEEVNNTKEILTTKLTKHPLLVIIGKEVDEEYIKAVTKSSLSKENNLRIIYSPLNGTGTTNVYPTLKKQGFTVYLDPKTKEPSGEFKHIKFKIPNPEVEQAYDTLKEYYQTQKADILITSDPDADRVGVMLPENWRFLTGNEIATLLTDYILRKKEHTNKHIVVKTLVTTTIIEKICKHYGVKCIGNLLVGFKYIAEQINQLENKDLFLFGAEESHGYLIGPYARDKDAAGAAMLISELAAELKKESKTLKDRLEEIYQKHGYVKNRLNEIRLLGASGVEKIAKIQEKLRHDPPKKILGCEVLEHIDYWQGKPFVSDTDKSSRNVIQLRLNKNNTEIRITIRPSGTEPKIKFYTEALGSENRIKINEIAEQAEQAIMDYAYKAIGVNFPKKGYLLFWQLPLEAKLKYFEVEEQIHKLKNPTIEKVNEILSFLGDNPLEKVNDCYKATYNKTIQEDLGL